MNTLLSTRPRHAKVVAGKTEVLELALAETGKFKGGLATAAMQDQLVDEAGNEHLEAPFLMERIYALALPLT
ncbi:hypothetical protein M2281_004441 [Mesorhizobium soli]|nr:hypothetical protein [Mesorhizobium soli]MDH6233828.1 hypothetical protein [Mesorhizobium soli]